MSIINSFRIITVGGGKVEFKYRRAYGAWVDSEKASDLPLLEGDRVAIRTRGVASRFCVVSNERRVLVVELDNKKDKDKHPLFVAGASNVSEVNASGRTILLTRPGMYAHIALNSSADRVYVQDGGTVPADWRGSRGTG